MHASQDDKSDTPAGASTSQAAALEGQRIGQLSLADQPLGHSNGSTSREEACSNAADGTLLAAHSHALPETAA